MDNPMKGEVTLRAAGIDYKLKITTNAVAAAEAATNAGFDAMVVNMGRLTYLRALLCAAMQEHHPKTTLEDAGKIIDAVGLKRVRVPLLEAVNRAFIEKDEEPEKNG